MLNRIGILGAGKVARHHAKALAAAGATIVAGSTRRADSPNWQAFRAEAPGARFVADGAAMLTDNEVEGIVVSLPWHEMPAWTVRLLACPKPMLIEKPLALEAAALESALASAPAFTRANGNKIVGYNRRFYVTVRRLRDRLAQGGLKAVYATMSEDVARHVEAHGPSVLAHLLAFASHSLDLLLHLVGPLAPARVYAHAERGYPAPVASFNGVLETEAGIPVFVAINTDDPAPAGLRFLFDDHTSWVLAPLERLEVYRGYEIAPEAPGAAIRRYTPRLVERVDEPAEQKPGFLAQARAFLSGRTAEAARPQESLALLRLIAALKGATRP